MLDRIAIIGEWRTASTTFMLTHNQRVGGLRHLLGGKRMCLRREIPNGPKNPANQSGLSVGLIQGGVPFANIGRQCT